MRTVAKWRVIMLNRSIHWGPADISRFMKRAETKVPWENLESCWARVKLSPHAMIIEMRGAINDYHPAAQSYHNGTSWFSYLAHRFTIWALPTHEDYLDLTVRVHSYRCPENISLGQFTLSFAQRMPLNQLPVFTKTKERFSEHNVINAQKKIIIISFSAYAQ